MNHVLEVTPTPVEFMPNVSRALGCDVFVKRDDLTHGTYGGNKVRKLVHLFEQARARRATDVVTLGAIGSHHVLATIVHGTAQGFRVHGVMMPQPANRHARENALADLARGGELIATRGPVDLAVTLAQTMARLRSQGRRPFAITVGGSTARGAAGYVDAVRELTDQLARGAMDAAPAVMVCALGSGGTHAGILAGVRAYGLASTVTGVQVTDTWKMVSRAHVARLARGAIAYGEPARAESVTGLRARDVVIDGTQLGAGYGHATDAGRDARELFALDGLVLDDTYTAKAAAGLVAHARSDHRAASYLFWHTLSSAPMAPLLAGANDTLPAAIEALLV